MKQMHSEIAVTAETVLLLEISNGEGFMEIFCTTVIQDIIQCSILCIAVADAAAARCWRSHPRSQASSAKALSRPL